MRQTPDHHGRFYFELMLDLAEGDESLRRHLCPRWDKFGHCDMRETPAELLRVLRELGTSQFQTWRRRVRDWAAMQLTRDDLWRYRPGEVVPMLRRLAEGIDVPATILSVQVRGTCMHSC